MLRAEGLKKKYRDRTVLENVSLQVPEASIVGLLGPNGAGKTTCFYIMVGLLQSDAGQIELDGKNITRLPMHKRALAGLGYLPQEASVFTGMSVENNILAILELHYPDKNSQWQKLDELLNDLQIQHIRHHKGSVLSGGERRRVEIARALASSPRFILLDEPFAGVDPISVQEIQAITLQLKERGIGVLITDHNVRETLGICDSAYILSDGKLLATGSAEELLANDQVRRVYLGEKFRL